MNFYFSEKASENSSRYFGWVIVGLTFFTMAVGGSIVGTFPVFYVAFLNEFGWSRADTALAFLSRWPLLRFPPALSGLW